MTDSFDDDPAMSTLLIDRKSYGLRDNPTRYRILDFSNARALRVLPTMENRRFLSTLEFRSKRSFVQRKSSSLLIVCSKQSFLVNRHATGRLLNQLSNNRVSEEYLLLNTLSFKHFFSKETSTCDLPCLFGYLFECKERLKIFV